MEKSIAEIVEYITRNHYQFEIEISKVVKLRKPIAEILQQHLSLEAYLRHIAELHHKDKLEIAVFSKNGSSIKRRGFFFVPIPAVATSVATSSEPIATVVATNVAECNEEDKPCPLHGVQPPYFTPPMPLHMDNSHAEILKVRLDFANQKTQDLERRNKELERKNEELYTENTKLIRENFTHKDKLDLEYKHKELELASQKSEGLNGLMEKISSLPPEGWQLLAGLFPNHPMNKQLPASTPALEGVKKHTDHDANNCMETITSVLIHQPVEVVAMMSMVVQSYASNPALLKKTYMRMYPAPALPTNNPNPQA